MNTHQQELFLWVSYAAQPQDDSGVIRLERMELLGEIFVRIDCRPLRAGCVENHTKLRMFLGHSFRVKTIRTEAIWPNSSKKLKSKRGLPAVTVTQPSSSPKSGKEFKLRPDRTEHSFGCQWDSKGNVWGGKFTRSPCLSEVNWGQIIACSRHTANGLVMWCRATSALIDRCFLGIANAVKIIDLGAKKAFPAVSVILI